MFPSSGSRALKAKRPAHRAHALYDEGNQLGQGKAQAFRPPLMTERSTPAADFTVPPDKPPPSRPKKGIVCQISHPHLRYFLDSAVAEA